MFSIRLRTVSAALSVLLLAGAADAAPKQKTEDPIAIKAAAAAPLSADALEALYSGKSWKWKDGGGYFSADRHRFIAWSQKGRAWSYGQGRWYATNRGKLCLQAYWVNKMGGGSDTTSFSIARKMASSIRSAHWAVAGMSSATIRHARPMRPPSCCAVTVSVRGWQS